MASEPVVNVLPDGFEAGQSAQRRYHDLRRDWLRAVMPRVRWVCWPVVVGATVIGIYFKQPVSFFAGMLAGGFYTILLASRDALPEYIQRWGVGAEGERRTARELRRLDSLNWRVAHDLKRDRGNLDHIVVGSAGVFLLDTKAWLKGPIELTPNGPRVTSRHDPDDEWTFERVPGAARGAARGLSDAIRDLTGQAPWVTAVVVIWGDFPGGPCEQDRVVYVAGEELVAWLEGLPGKKLSAGRVEAIGRWIG
jgi:hypothetical protein